MLDRLFGRLLDALADRVALRLRAPITHDGSVFSLNVENGRIKHLIDGTALNVSMSDAARRARQE